jgi:hypothetical protein
MTCYTEELIDEVLKQIVEDVGKGDITAIEELLQNVTAPRLLGYLPEEKADALREKWDVVEVDWTQ